MLIYVNHGYVTIVNYTTKITCGKVCVDIFHINFQYHIANVATEDEQTKFTINNGDTSI